MYLFNYLNIFCETLMYSLYLQLQIYYDWTYFLPSLVPSLFINAFNINLLLMSLINYIVYLFQREYVNVEEIQLMVWLIVSIVLYIRFERRHNNILLLFLLLINIIMLISRKNRYSYMKYWILSNTALHFVLSYYVYVFLCFCVSVFLSFYLSVFLSFCIFIFLSLSLSLSVFLSFFLSFCLSVFLSFCISVFLFFFLSIFLFFYFSVFLSFFLSFYLSIFLFFCFSFCFSFNINISLIPIFFNDLILSECERILVKELGSYFLSVRIQYFFQWINYSLVNIPVWI